MENINKTSKHTLYAVQHQKHIQHRYIQQKYTCRKFNGLARFQGILNRFVQILCDHFDKRWFSSSSE